MKTSKILAAAAFTLLAAAGAQAETYQGVLTVNSLNSRAEVAQQAVAAAHTADPYAEGYGQGVQPVLASSVDRSVIRSQAVAAAHTADPYAEGASSGVAPLLASSVDRATVRAEARAAARGNIAAL